MRPDPTAYAIKFQQLVFGLALLALGFLITGGVMRGTARGIVAAIAMIVGAALILLLDRHYWMLCPLGFAAQGLIKPMGLEMAEIGCIAVIGTHFVRRTLRQGIGDTQFRPAVFLALPHFVWMAIAFSLNPPGIAAMGDTVIGSRFYIKVLLGFWAMMVLSIQKITEDDCRIIFRISLILGTLVLGRSLLGAAMVDEEKRTVVTLYQFLPATALFYWLFAHFRFGVFFRFSWHFFVAGILTVATLYAGKRRAVFNVALFPLLRAFVTRTDRSKTMAAYLAALIALVLLLFGQGRLYELPLPIQRGLSFLPAKWERRIAAIEGARDPFRDNVRSYAWVEVRKNPLFGRRGFAIPMQELNWVHYGGTTKDHEGHAIAGNWHNTWVGVMADFGIPGALWWGLFSISLLVAGHIRLRQCAGGSYQQTVVIYHYCGSILMILASHTSGHSALQPFQWWPIYGLLLGITPGLQSLNGRQALTGG